MFYLFKPIRIPFLPVPTVSNHFIYSILSTPAKFALGFRGVRVNDRNIAGTAVINDIRDLDAVHAFKGFYELQNAVALPCSKVVHCETTVVLDRLESVYVASGEVFITVAINLLPIQESLRQAFPLLILLRQVQRHINFRPPNANVRIIPGKSSFIVRMVEVIALVAELSFIGENQEAMSEASRNQELFLVLGRELYSVPFPEGGTPFPDINRNIKHCAAHNAN